MNRYRYIYAVLLAVFAVLIGHAIAAPQPLYLNPIGRQGTAPPVLLVDHDCGFVSAVNAQGRFFVSYQTRPDGHVHVAEDVGDKLVDLADPFAQPPSVAAPAFELPGPKQGSASMVADGAKIRLYYTGRAPGDEAGEFKVWKLIVTP